MKQKIRLVGMVQDELHAEGFVDKLKIRTCGNLVRNGHHYTFSGRFTTEGNPIFAEIPTPWDITGEFEQS